jgi:signal transduction histidine kinase
MQESNFNEISQGVLSLVENLGVPLLISQKDRIIYFNKELAAFLNRDLNNLLSRSFSDTFKSMPKENLPNSYLGDFSGETRNSPGEYSIVQFTDNDNKPKNYFIRKKAFLDKGAELNLMIFLEVTDTTLLKVENERLRKQNALRTNFMANMSHEIRTPLNSIIGFTDLLMDDDSTAEEEELYKRLIATSGKSLMQLISDLIDISKIDAQQLKIDKTEFDLNVFLDELLVSCRQEQKLRGLDNIDIKLAKGTNQGPFLIYTDELRLRQVISNLVTNSLKFTDTGFISIGYVISAHNQIQFYVKDTGTGINKEARTNIFDSFKQDKYTRGRNTEGSGLGLAISKSLIKMLGGEIWLDTESGFGTTVYFTLPNYYAKERGQSSYFSNKMDIPDYGGKKILIVDDIMQNVFYLKSLLKVSNAKLLVANSGDQAIKICNENSDISIVLMDIMMPFLDGYSACKEIKRSHPEISVIMQTAFTLAGNKEKSYASGASDFLSKPIKPQTLFNSINKFIGV